MKTLYLSTEFLFQAFSNDPESLAEWIANLTSNGSELLADDILAFTIVLEGLVNVATKEGSGKVCYQ